MDSFIGPSIPKHLLPKRDKQDTEDDPDILPSSKRSRKEDSSSKNDDSLKVRTDDTASVDRGPVVLLPQSASDSLFGPVLPPEDIQQKNINESYGPQLPPDMIEVVDTGSTSRLPITDGGYPCIMLIALWGCTTTIVIVLLNYFL